MSNFSPYSNQPQKDESNLNIKTRLRNFDFPDVVTEALSRIENSWLPDCTSCQLLVMKEISREFVFFEVDPWGLLRNRKISPIKELQVLEKMCSYFKDPGPEQKFATFLFLFPVGSALLQSRMPWLNKLVSLAVALGNGNILTYIGMWMQVAGCSSPHSTYLAKSFQQERLRESVCRSEIIKNLPNCSKFFCASILTALSSLYPLQPPPDHIIEVVLRWLKSKPSFCYAPLNMTLPEAFNTRYTWTPQCPIPEISHWCITLPLSCPYVSAYRASLFSALHAAVLNSMLNASKYYDYYMVEALPTEKIENTISVLKSFTNVRYDDLSLSLERLAQVMESGLSNNCIHRDSGRLGKLFVYCIDLPFNQLMKIVLQKWSYEIDSSAVRKGCAIPQFALGY